MRAFHYNDTRLEFPPFCGRDLRASGEAVNEKRVSKVMREAGIRSKSSRKFRVTTTDSHHTQPVAANVLNREFTAEQRNQKWVAGIDIATLEGWLYLAAVIDLFSRKVVGWSMSERIDSRLVVGALEIAVARELPDVGLVAHSDWGVQYASEHYQGVLQQHGLECSMSRQRDCWDNAPMESFIATLKKELVHHESYATREAARASLFEYIEVFYKRERRHSALGNVPTIAFEEAAKSASPVIRVPGGSRGRGKLHQTARPAHKKTPQIVSICGVLKCPHSDLNGEPND